MRRVGQTALLLLISASAIAQQEADQPSFRSGVELLQLDVAVLDGQRRPVRGLTADEFTVLENGVRRPIRSFVAVDMPARTQAQQPVWAKDAAPDVATNQIAKDEGRLVILLMDRSIPYLGGTVQAQKIALAAVDQLGPQDVAAVISTSGAYRPQTFTADRTRLVRAINQRDWSSESSLAPWSIDGGGDPRCFCGLCVLETLTTASDAVRNIPRRRKLLLFIGRGIVINLAPLGPNASPGCEHDVKAAREKLFESLAVSNLTIHSIDPRDLANVGDHTQASVSGTGLDRPANGGPQTRLQALQGARNDLLRTQQSLAVLPERTGGRTVVNTNASLEKVAEIFEESNAYYVLGVERDPSAKPSTRRSVTIEVARRNVRAHAQRHFLAPGPDPAVRPAKETPSTPDALSALLPDAGKPLALHLAAFAKPDGEGGSVRITLNAAAFVRDAASAALDISAIAVDQAGVTQGSAKQMSTLIGPTGDKTRTPLVTIPTYLDLRPGDYEIRVAVVDRAAGASASVFAQILVPNFAAERLSLSDLVVEASPATPPSDTTTVAVDATATTERAFGRGAQVRAVFQIYQGTERTDAIVPVTTRVRVVDSRGAVARDQSIVFAAADFHARRTDCRINLPINGLPAGDYLLEIIATAGGEHQTRKLRFAVQ